LRLLDIINSPKRFVVYNPTTRFLLITKHVMFDEELLGFQRGEELLGFQSLVNGFTKQN
jgi:hypothetical protein